MNEGVMMQSALLGRGMGVAQYGEQVKVRPGDVAAPQQTPIFATVSELDRVISELHATLADFEKRLEPILRPAAPDSTGQELKEADCSAMAARLYLLVRRVRGANERLLAMMSRSEL